jgi:hypothetical protein
MPAIPIRVVRSTHLQLAFLCKLSESSLTLLVMRLVQVHYPRGIPTEGRELRVLLFPAQEDHDQQRSLSLTVQDLNYGLARSRNLDSIRCRRKRIVSSLQCPDCSAAHPASYAMRNGGTFLED